MTVTIGLAALSVVLVVGAAAVAIAMCMSAARADRAAAEHFAEKRQAHEALEAFGSESEGLWA